MALENAYELKGENLVSVCASCFPRETVFLTYPFLKGADISHGICPKHKREMLAELEIELGKKCRLPILDPVGLI